MVPVNVTLFYEAFCPDCERFILNQLSPDSAQLGSAVAVTLVPYGNANTRGNTVTCQHGPDECTGNIWENCAIKYYQEFNDHFNFIVCLERYGRTMLHHAEDCAKEANLDFDKIKACAESSEGYNLLIQAGEQTPNNHQYVPWLHINGKHNTEAESDFLRAICKYYSGSSKPKACQNLAVSVDLETTCAPDKDRCEYAPGKIQCCLSGEYCIPKVGCRCANEFLKSKPQSEMK